MSSLFLNRSNLQPEKTFMDNPLGVAWSSNFDFFTSRDFYWHTTAYQAHYRPLKLPLPNLQKVTSSHFQPFVYIFLIIQFRSVFHVCDQTI